MSMNGCVDIGRRVYYCICPEVALGSDAAEGEEEKRYCQSERGIGGWGE